MALGEWQVGTGTNTTTYSCGQMEEAKEEEYGENGGIGERQKGQPHARLIGFLQICFVGPPLLIIKVH
jgi:hypothetical protein